MGWGKISVEVCGIGSSLRGGRGRDGEPTHGVGARSPCGHFEDGWMRFVVARPDSTVIRRATRLLANSTLVNVGF